MYHRITLTLLFLAGFAVAAEAPNAKWLIEGFDSPESVVYDAASKTLYVSNIVGGGDAKDGKGWISKLSADDRKTNEMKWVEGLNAPKGMRLHKGTLWVADIDELVAIDTKTKTVGRVPVKGSKFLNDVAVGPDGAVYVTDTMLSKIFVVRDGKASVLAEGDDLEQPNGVLYHDGRLIVAAWGKITDPETFGTKVPGRLFSLDATTGKDKKLITKEPTGNLDGVEIDSKGDFIVTDWKAGKVLRITPQGKTTTLLEGFKGAADHALILEKNLIVVPRMLENKVSAHELN